MIIPDFLCSQQLSRCEGISHGFFTRQGGVSSGEFDSLNCSFASQDSRSDVAQNRLRVMQSLGAEKMVSLQQIHSRDIHLVDTAFAAEQVAQGDGMVSLERGIGLGVLGADCAPVLFADPVAGIVGAAHAGWKGAVSGVTDAVIDAMEGVGASVENISVAIGPAIQKQSYEVGVEFARTFAGLSSIDCERFFVEREGAVYFDLPGYIEQRLVQRGITNPDVIAEDTYAQSKKFFSYRRMCPENGKFYGRQIGVISLTK